LLRNDQVPGGFALSASSGLAALPPLP